MKKGRNYEINHLDNTVVVTKRFYDEATQLGEARDLLEELKSKGYRLVVEQRAERKSPKTAKEKRRITYKMMETYISLLEDSEDMLKGFTKVKKLSHSKRHPYEYVLKWFHKEFPRYEDYPTFDDNWNVIHDPNPVATALPQKKTA